MKIIDLKTRPELMPAAARWFHEAWGIPQEAYLECMTAYLAGETPLGWFLALEGETVCAGLGVIENDFHDRPDLSPNICAVYTLPAYRGRGLAGQLLNTAVETCRARGISPVYLLTNHTGFYERYGWEFLCIAQGEGDDAPSRMYIHR